MTSDELRLVREYAARGSEAAFEALVACHINLVYSAALRRTGDAFMAEEITQVVFIILARKAASLGPKTVLSGWLYRTALYVAANALRSQHRRQQHEQEAYMQSIPDEAATDNAWQELSPLLDEGMARLGQADRDALVLRFFEGRSLEQVSVALGLSEAAAKKRVQRAVEKLRGFFARRGIVSTASILTAAISTHSVQAAPVTLATAVTAAAAANGATAGASPLILLKGTLKFMAWAKAKTAAMAVGLLLVCGMGAITVTNTLPAKSDAPVLAASSTSKRPEDFSGIGVLIAGRWTQTEPLRLRVFPGSPAQRAGMKPDGFLISINGANAVSMSTSQTLSRVWGPAGTSLTLEVADATMRHTNKFTVRRIREWSYPTNLPSLLASNRWSSYW